MFDIIRLYFKCIRAEFYKIKHSKILWISLLGPLVIAALKFASYLYYAELYIPKNAINPWAGYFAGNWQAISFLLLPFYLILISNLVVYIEHKSGTWKDIFILPINTKFIFISKFTVILVLFILTLIYFTMIQIISGLALGLIITEFRFLEFTPDFLQSAEIVLKLFVSALSIISLQFWLSLRNKNYVVPVSIGIIGIVFGILIFQFKYSLFIPFTYPIRTTYQYFHIMNLKHAGTGFLYWHELVSLLYLILFLLFGYKEYMKLKRI